MDIMIHYRDLARSDALDDSIRRSVQRVLERFASRLTRIDVHVADESGPKGGIDKRCLIEARPAGESAVSAEFLSNDAYRAVRGAVTRLRRVLTRRFERR
ncbi:MAG: HPF/RaiA family ribosome-associated protein [Phycisphaeraceae bacterium]|nr:HPF/RaiA family ribosome-associated protein [Phycisphaeraceae bacterium]MCW5755495.1 HPF/RaiA family ribosome-associated protein [Phycisphaeraceae bacterium]